MNDLTIFKNENFGEVRTVLIDNEVWFVLKDVCSILGIENHRDLTKRLEDDEVGRFDITHPQNHKKTIEMLCTNEYGLYSVILRSDKPNAKQFKRWITHKVLPQIRKTGAFLLAPKDYAEALRVLANEVEQKELMQRQRDEAIRTKALIGSRREATAMATASHKSREVERLKMELDRSREFASIKAVEIKTKRKFEWRLLRNYCNSHELEMPKIFDSNYGSVRTYPAKAWKELYEIRLGEIFSNSSEMRAEDE